MRIEARPSGNGAAASSEEGTFAPLPRRRATADAITAIQDRIRNGELHPGARLPSERALSEALGVSRPTVREAVQSLAAMNILQVRHGAGIFVASLDLDALLTPMRFALELNEPTVDHLFEVRTALEPCAAQFAAARATDEQVAEIVACAARMGRRGLTNEELIEVDVELHRRIVDASQNELLINLVASLNVLSRRSRELTARIPGVTTRTRRDHHAIAAAIAARDPQRAYDTMASHLANVRASVEKARSRRGRTAAA